jgi:N-methylhydantoinase A
MLESDLKHDYVRTFYGQLGSIDLESLNRAFTEMEEEGRRTLEREGIPAEMVRIERSMDMRYVGQHHEVTVAVPGGELSSADIPGIAGAFHQVHERLYTYAEPESDVEVINLRVAAVGLVPKTPLQEEEDAGPDARPALKGTRAAFVEDAGGMVEVPVYDGHRLRCGNVLEGPAIVELVTTTVVLFPGNRGRVDAFGNLIVEVSARDQ